MADFEEADYANDNVSDAGSESSSPCRRRRSPSPKSSLGEDKSCRRRVEHQENQIIDDVVICVARAQSPVVAAFDVGPAARGSVAGLVPGLVRGRYTIPSAGIAPQPEVVRSKPRPPYKAFPGRKTAPDRGQVGLTNISETFSVDCAKIVEPQNSAIVTLQRVDTSDISAIDASAVSLEASSRDSLDAESQNVSMASDHLGASNSAKLTSQACKLVSMKVSEEEKEVQTSKALEPHASVDLSASDDEEEIPADVAEGVAEQLQCSEAQKADLIEPIIPPIDVSLNDSTSSLRSSAGTNKDHSRSDSALVDAIEDHAMGEDQRHQIQEAGMSVNISASSLTNTDRIAEELDASEAQQVDAVKDDHMGARQKSQTSEIHDIARIESDVVPDASCDQASVPSGKVTESPPTVAQEAGDEDENDDNDDCMILEVSLPPAPLRVPTQEEIAEAERLDNMRRIVSLAPIETADEDERLAARAARFGTTITKPTKETSSSASSHALQSGFDGLQEEEDLPPLPEVILFKDKVPLPKSSNNGGGFLSTLLREPILSHRVVNPPSKAAPAVRMSSSSSSGSVAPVPQAKKMPRIEKKPVLESNGNVISTNIAVSADVSSNASQHEGSSILPPSKPAAPSDPPVNSACWLWTKFGKCKYGTSCKFAHNQVADTHKQLLHMRRRLGDVDLVPDWKRFKSTDTEAPRRAPNFGLREECGLDLPLFEDSDLGAYIDSSLLQGETQIAEAPQVETEAEVDPYLDVELGTSIERKDDLGEERAAAFRQAFEELPEADEI